MRDLVDPMSAAARWLVTTASGAQHLIESTGPDGVVTTTRVTSESVTNDREFPLAALRRDGDALLVAAVTHLESGAPVDGIVVGEDMYLALEPLSPLAFLTVRRTTPVVAIDVLPEMSSDG